MRRETKPYEYLPAKHAQKVADLVRSVELQLIAALKTQIVQGNGANGYQVRQLIDLSRALAHAEQILGGDWERVINEAQTVLNQAVEAGQGQARVDLKKLGIGPTLPGGLALGIEMTALDTLAALTGMKPIILREFVDAYQALMTGPVTGVVSGSFTRLEATQQALLAWARQGIPGFIDRGGREWSMDAYAEMAVRTGAANAMREGHAATLKAAGEDLIQITGHGYTCPKCAKYQGKILSLGGTSPGVYLLPHATNPNELIPVHVEATIQEATADGLYHPNCAHTQILYLPGITTPYDAPANVETYDKSQDQRALEREVRRVKRELAAAFLPETVADLRREKARLQKRIRELVASNPMLTREPTREQIKTAH